MVRGPAGFSTGLAKGPVGDGPGLVLDRVRTLGSPRQLALRAFGNGRGAEVIIPALRKSLTRASPIAQPLPALVDHALARGLAAPVCHRLLSCAVPFGDVSCRCPQCGHAFIVA